MSLGLERAESYGPGRGSAEIGAVVDRDSVRLVAGASSRLSSSVSLYADAWAGFARAYGWRIEYGADGGVRIVW